MKLIAACAGDSGATALNDAQKEPFLAEKARENTLWLPNDADAALAVLGGVECIVLDFPKFTDGRAFSQAFTLRRRRGFTGDIRATGDVLADQLPQMQRSGFSSAVLRSDQNEAVARQVLASYPGTSTGSNYQGDAVQSWPPFARPQTS